MSASPKRRKRPTERAGRDQEEQSMYEIHNGTTALCTNFKTQITDTSATKLLPDPYTWAMMHAYI